jgi:two-component system, OmpR family, response regulator
MSRPNVLVVDDDFLLLEMITAMFQRAGLEVDAASTGEAALTLIRDKGESIDWLFTDINLAGLINGWQVASDYRKRYPRRPIIYASAGRRFDGLTTTGSIFVQKPFQPSDIIALAALVYHELAEFSPDAVQAQLAHEAAYSA